MPRFINGGTEEKCVISTFSQHYCLGAAIEWQFKNITQEFFNYYKINHHSKWGIMCSQSLFVTVWGFALQFTACVCSNLVGASLVPFLCSQWCARLAPGWELSGLLVALLQTYKKVSSISFPFHCYLPLYKINSLVWLQYCFRPNLKLHHYLSPFLCFNLPKNQTSSRATVRLNYIMLVRAQ